MLAPPAAEAAKILQAETGLEIEVNTTGGSEAGVAALAAKQVQIVLCGRRVSGEERAAAPSFTFNEIVLGEYPIALAVSPDVWRGGVRALTRAQMRDIYEGRVTDWSKLGGPKAKIAFFNRDEGRSVWEIFAQWLYGGVNKAPGTNFDTLATDAEVRETLSRQPGALSQISALLADGVSLFPLALRDEQGKSVEPTFKNLSAHRYPMSQQLFLVVNDRPTGAVKVYVDFMLGPRGQKILKKHGFAPVAELEKENQP